jgi:hypothetical protein
MPDDDIRDTRDFPSLSRHLRTRLDWPVVRDRGYAWR